jgi:hypothetical protein
MAIKDAVVRQGMRDRLLHTGAVVRQGIRDGY